MNRINITAEDVKAKKLPWWIPAENQCQFCRKFSPITHVVLNETNMEYWYSCLNPKCYFVEIFPDRQHEMGFTANTPKHVVAFKSKFYDAGASNYAGVPTEATDYPL